MLAGVELGGTKVVCLVGTGPDDVNAELQRPTREPESTLAEVAAFFRQHPVEALGIASFGPVELRRRSPGWGSITRTPKPGWSGIDVAGPLGRALGVPVAFDTDVNGAALGEGRWGAARGLNTFVYVTVGTGIGGGAVVGGRVLHGLVHPEFGHIPVPPQPGDVFTGVCPFHRDCLEGMTSGPALAARFGMRLEEADERSRGEAAALAAGYLASGLRTLVYALAPQRIVLGAPSQAARGARRVPRSPRARRRGLRGRAGAGRPSG
jgi:fructokinase